MANLSCADQVRKAREAAGVSQEKLARLAEVSIATISRIELLNHVPTVTTLWQIAKALGVPMQSLVAEDGADVEDVA